MTPTTFESCFAIVDDPNRGACRALSTRMTTIGQLIASLYDRYERMYVDRYLVAIATQRDLNKALRSVRPR